MQSRAQRRELLIAGLQKQLGAEEALGFVPGARGW